MADLGGLKRLEAQPVAPFAQVLGPAQTGEIWHLHAGSRD